MFLLVLPTGAKDVDKYTMPTIVWIYLGAISLFLIVGLAIVLIDMLSGFHGTIWQLTRALFPIELIAMATPIWADDDHSYTHSPNV